MFGLNVVMDVEMNASNHDWTEITPEALKAEWWHAVYLPIPENVSPDLLREAHWMVEYCYTGAARYAQGDHRAICDPTKSVYAPRGDAVYHAQAALDRLDELERLDPSLRRQSAFEPQHPELRDRLGLSSESSLEGERDKRIARVLEDHHDKRKHEEDFRAPSNDKNARDKRERTGEIELTEAQRERLDRMLEANPDAVERSTDREGVAPDFTPGGPSGGRSR
jgi:hypothetical protein